ncbi:MAG: hypothetical protein J7K26_01180, partial [Candidatus Aenigmarchaeota archaeon]|nr:hypothetical protein [Candidatus Aenigmarchaeota archaeon]
MKKKILFGIWIFLFLIVLSNSTYAIGISPSRTIIDFEPGLSSVYNYYVLGSEDKTTYAKLYVKGDLAEYFTLYTDSVQLSPGEIKELQFEINLPQELEPGIHDTRIGVVETTGPEGDTGATVGGIAGVEYQFWVRVPYPGYYISASLNIPDVGIGETIPFTLEINNLGQNDISSLSAIIDIYDSDNNIIKTLQTDTVSLPKSQKKTFVLNWDAPSMDTGTYKAIATINYDGNTKTIKSEFTIGELLVKITDIRINDIQFGTIGKAEIDIESTFNKEISDVWATLEVLKDNNKIKSFNTNPVNIPAKGKEKLIGYIDTEGLETGQYTLKVILHYEDKTSEKTKLFNIVPAKKLTTGLP